MASKLDHYLDRIPKTDLDQPIDYKHVNIQGQYTNEDLGRIAEAMHEWESTATTVLGLSDVDIADTKEKYPGKPLLMK
jgi:hypothetical protein